VVGTAAQVLTTLAAGDRSFRQEMARLVGQAEQDPAIGVLATTIARHARVGKVVTIGHAGAVHVHLPASPSPTVLDRLHRAQSAGPVVANLPPRNPTFTGRGNLLDQLHASLHPGQAAAIVQDQARAIHGLGGIGKTQLALEYAHKHASNYDLVWWVTAEEPATIPGQLVALARRLDIAEATEQAETVQLLWDELRQRDRWLLIFDNAEAPADLRPWWPPASGRVLVTSRHPTWGGLATTIPLDVLARDESRLFLQRRLASAFHWGGWWLPADAQGALSSRENAAV
jgi:NB-ARC domain